MSKPSVVIGTFAGNEVIHEVEYHDTDSFEGLAHEKCRQVYGVCFCGEKMVIGF